MVTKKQIDFLKFSQGYKAVKKGFVSLTLVNILRLLKTSDTAYKIDFFERMLNYIKVIACETLANNNYESIISETYSDFEQISNNKDIASFVEFMLQFHILEFKSNKLNVNKKYSRLIHKNIVSEIIVSNGKPLGLKLTCYERKLVNDFLFISDLIEKYDNTDYRFKYIGLNYEKWESLLADKKLDYEIRLCKTFFNLVNLRLPKKIKSPFDEDFYTESGRNAFKNYTRYIFKTYLRKVSKGINSLNSISVFDLGCGYGDYIGAVHEAFDNYTVTGVEINPAVYSETVNKFREIKNVEIINEDFFNYNPNQKYDVLLMNYVLFYFTKEEKQRVLGKAKSILNNNGSIILCQYMSGIEHMKKELAKQQGDYSVSKKIEMYYSDKVLYANTLWNDSVDTFAEAVKWDELKSLLSEQGLYIESMTNADRFYYSLFIEIKKN